MIKLKFFLQIEMDVLLARVKMEELALMESTRTLVIAMMGIKVPIVKQVIF